MINVGVIGLSQFAVSKMIPALQLSSHLKLYGVASHSNANSRAFSLKNNCMFYDSYEDLINSSDIELVYIPLPNAMHFPWAKKALIACKHVLVEKPLALDYSQSNELVQLAANSGNLLSENFLFPHHSQSKWLFDRLDGHLTGTVTKLTSRFFIPKRSISDIRYKQDLGGGALNDLGCYMVKLINYLFGDRASLVSSNIYMSRKYNVDVKGDATYLIDNSIEAQFSWGFDSHYENSFAIEGSKSLLKTNRFFTMPPREKPLIYLDNNLLCSLHCDNQYCNKWNSLGEIINSTHLFESHLSTLLVQAKNLEYIKKNSCFFWI